MKIQGMKVFLTGGSGFIGNHLATFLTRMGCLVTIYDLRKPQKDTQYHDFIKGNILDERRLIKALTGHDYVIHLAGQLGTHELIEFSSEANAVNVGGTIHVLNACRKHGIKLIEFSKPNCWLNTYTITKIAAEGFVQMYEKEFGIEAVIVRPFNVYGSGQPTMEQAGYQKAVPTWLEAASSGDPIEVYGDGTQTMDLVHTSDVSRAAKAIMENWKNCRGKTFDLGNSEEVTANELAIMIKAITASESEIVHLPMRPGETEHTRIKADIDKLQSCAGWQPQTKLLEGLVETAKWYDRQRELKKTAHLDKFLLFMPVFNTGSWLQANIAKLDHCRCQLKKQGTEMLLHLVDDGSEPETKKILRELTKTYEFLTVEHNQRNCGQQVTLLKGWQWALSQATEPSIIAHMDSDGDFQVQDILPALSTLKAGNWDGIVGSLMLDQETEEESFRTELRALAQEQSMFNGFCGTAKVQSCGFGLWRAPLVSEGMKKLPTYTKYYQKIMKRNLTSWGFHGTMQTIFSLVMKGDTKVIDLVSSESSPGRDPQKMATQVSDGYAALNVLRAFIASSANV